MTDFFLLGSNVLIGILFFGLWTSDQSRLHFAHWGVGKVLMATGGAMVLIVTRENHPLLLVSLLLVTTGMAFMVNGSFAFAGRRASTWYAIGCGLGGTILLGFTETFVSWMTPWIISAGLALCYGSVSWVTWRGNMLERFAALLFVLSAANGISLTLTESFGHNLLQAHLSHLLSLSAAVCLLIGTFDRRAQELANQNELLTFSNNLITSLQEKQSEEELAQEALRLLAGSAADRYGLIHVLNADRKVFELLASHRHPEEVLRVVRHMPVEHTLSGKAVSLGDAVVTREYAKESGAWQELARVYQRTGVNANVSIPIMIGTRALGVMNISYPDRHEFSRRELDTLKAAGKIVATCLERIRHIRDLAFRANHDALTGLENREALHARFNEELKSRRNGILALVLLDLNRFKEVNDTLGHFVGDRLLVEVARVLQAHVTVMGGHVFRLGGDEFAVLLPHEPDEPAAMAKCQALVGLINQPIRIDEMALHVDAAMGIGLCPKHSSDSHELLRCADVAMYSAKARGIPVASYDRLRDVHTPARLNLLGAIPKAIHAQEFVMHYQPQIRLTDNKPTSYETLIRWQHPQHGLLAPDMFFPLAEVSDVIHPLTDHILDTTMAQARTWRDLGMKFRTALNLSARNILDPKLTGRMLELLQKHGLEPQDIELELTETALLHDPATSAMVLNGLAEHGFNLALDDFGTGFSSLTYLKRYPFQVVKIDRSFVEDMERDPASLAIVRSTIQLSHELNMKVVAEGVSNQNTMDILRQLSCDAVQGFFISHPIEHELVPGWHRKWEGVK